METIDQLSLAEIVLLRPKVSNPLENRERDFCCGGKTKVSDLETSPQEKSSHAEAFKTRFVKKEFLPEIDFKKFSATALIGFIEENHHSYLKENLPQILRQLTITIDKYGSAFPNLIKIKASLINLNIYFRQQLYTEENYLFPKIKQLESYSQECNFLHSKLAGIPRKELQNLAHLEVGKMMQEIKLLSNNYKVPIKSCSNYSYCYESLAELEKELYQHVLLEYTMLLPKVLEIQQRLSYAPIY